jgi:U3 small nucleolar RNA-associated protein 10
MVEVLKEEMLPLVPKMLEQCFSILLDNLQSDSPNQQLQHACFMVLIAIAEYIPFILSAEKLDNAIQLTQLSIARADGDNTKTQDKLYSTLAQTVSASEIFSAVQRNYDVARRKQGFDPLLQYYKLAKLSIESHTKSEATKSAAVLFKFLMGTFELRSLAKSSPGDFQISQSETEDLETVAIDVALSLVLKLNDVTFRPFFIHIVEWATAKTKETTSDFTSRAITLFRFTKALVHRLKVKSPW